MILETKIVGIPCLAKMKYHAPLSGSLDEPPEVEGFTIEEVFDRTGRPAQWLMDKLTEEETTRIVSEAFSDMQNRY